MLSNLLKRILTTFFSITLLGAPLLLPAQTFYFCDTTTVDGRPGAMRLGFFDLDSCSARFSRFTYSTTANDIGIFYDVPTGGLVQFYGFAFNPITENVMDYIGYGVNTIGPEAFQRNSEINTDTIQAFTCGGIHDDVFHTPYYYAAGKGLFAVNERRGEGVTFLGNFPEGMEAAGDLTVRSNRLFMTTKSHTLVEVDVDNPANSEVIMHFPDSIPLIYAPNAFSPNGDGRNDYFTLYGAADWVQLNSLRIYDRWGALVFERLEPALGSETDGWDGTIQGRTLPAGVYVYFAELSGPAGETEVMNGEVVLLR